MSNQLTGLKPLVFSDLPFVTVPQGAEPRASRVETRWAATWTASMPPDQAYLPVPKRLRVDTTSPGGSRRSVRPPFSRTKPARCLTDYLSVAPGLACAAQRGSCDHEDPEPHRRYPSPRHACGGKEGGCSPVVDGVVCFPDRVSRVARNRDTRSLGGQAGPDGGATGFRCRRR